MRIIAGKYRGRRLRSPSSLRTRPTSDRLRETLFNVVAPRIEGARFLDLCAGTGAVGIEALSRAAEHVTFVDQSRKMCMLIETNTNALKVDRGAYEIVTSEAADFLRQHFKEANDPFDLVFFDPPYSGDYETTLKYFGGHSSRLLADEGIVLVEHFSKNSLQDQYEALKRYRVLKQGDSSLSFYRSS